MTAKSIAGAASHENVDWHAIDWQKAHYNVRRLQARIVKATQEGKWGKVKALQRLLTHSFSGKTLAVRRVTENQGKNTPGVDRIIWNTPQKKLNGVYSLRQRGYHPQPLRRIYIPRKTVKSVRLGFRYGLHTTCLARQCSGFHVFSSWWIGVPDPPLQSYFTTH